MLLSDRPEVGEPVHPLAPGPEALTIRHADLVAAHGPYAQLIAAQRRHA